MIELLVVFIFGIVIGSFLNVLILRIPLDESILFPASHCTSCNNKLKPWHNIPIISWVFLRGKCSYCNSKISIQYPVVELITGLILVGIVYKLGINIQAVIVFLSFSMLLTLSMIDLKYKMVPDSINLLAMVFAILSFSNPTELFSNFHNALLFAGGFTLLRFGLSYILTSAEHRRALKTITPWTKNYHTYPFIEAVGEGDIMVVATMGALLGIKLTLIAIFLSAVLALPVMLIIQRINEKEKTVPYVPFLTLATLIVYIFDTQTLSLMKLIT